MTSSLCSLLSHCTTLFLRLYLSRLFFFFFFFNDTATTEIYTLSLHDALPIFIAIPGDGCVAEMNLGGPRRNRRIEVRDRKSTRLNSSHRTISYAVFCLKKKKKKIKKRISHKAEKS